MMCETCERRRWWCWLIACDELSERLDNASINTPQPPPKKNNHPAVWDLVVADMVERDRLGAKKYGTRLKPHNGRDNLVDAYQEALDLVVYLRSEIYERDSKCCRSAAATVAALSDLSPPVGDGVWDDTEAVQAWLDKKGYLPSKGTHGSTYRITVPLKVR